MSERVQQELEALAERYDNATVIGEVTTILPITVEMLDSVLIGAFDGGYGASYYWAEVEEIRVNGEHWTEVLLRQRDEFDEEIQRKVYLINAENIIPAIQRFLTDDPPANKQITGYIRQAVQENDPGIIDADAADCIVQIAAFGQLVYG